MRKAGVIGWPVAHSLSPKLHQFWLKKYTIEGSYEPFAVEPKDLQVFLAKLRDEGFSGANVTVPHKENVIAMLDEIDATAKAIGAVNTVIVKDEKLKGSNTDAYGFTENLKQRNAWKVMNKAVVIGAGGAARAVVKALIDAKCKHIVVVNRTAAKAEAIASAFGGKIEVVPWERREAVLSGADLLVNTTTLGMKNGEPLDLGLEALPEEAVVTDIVYTPLTTSLLVEAKARGNRTIDGLGMLLWQAVPGFEAWFGVRPEVDDAVREHVLHG